MKKFLPDWETAKNLSIIRVSAQRDELKVALSRGGIAQLGERLHGMQEVIGSIPFTSTKIYQKREIGS